MSRFLNTRSGLLACGVILGLGFVSATAGVGLAQSALKKRYVGRIPNERVLASLNERVRMHAESLLGSQVGGGECTDLVNEVLRFCNAKQIHIRSDGQYEWGQAIPLYKKEGGLFVIPGDILQFENVELKGGGSSYKYPHHTAIVRSVVALAKSLNLAVTGEGIETAEQLGQLQALGCDRGQGYLFAKPLSAAEIDDVLTNGVRVPYTDGSRQHLSVA